MAPCHEQLPAHLRTQLPSLDLNPPIPLGLSTEPVEKLVGILECGLRSSSACSSLGGGTGRGVGNRTVRRRLSLPLLRSPLPLRHRRGGPVSAAVQCSITALPRQAAFLLFHTHPPKRLAHPRLPIPPLSTLTSRATHAHPTTLHPAALASVPYGIVLVRVRVFPVPKECVSFAADESPYIFQKLVDWTGLFRQ